MDDREQAVADQEPPAHCHHNGGAPGWDTDSDHFYAKPEVALDFDNTRQVLQIAPCLGTSEEKRRKTREGKEIRMKKKLKEQIQLVERLTGDECASIEERLNCSMRDLLKRGMLREIVAKDGKKYYAVFFTGSDKQKKILRVVCGDSSVFPLIRHGGPWADVPGLLERKDFQYETGTRQYVQPGWVYNASSPNLTLTWTIHAADYEGIGRGGLQPEDEIEPHMTEPFAAITKDFQNLGIGSCFFRTHLIKLYNEISDHAPMRILCMEGNEQSKALAESQELPDRTFKYQRNFEHPEWGQTYKVFESGSHTSAPSGCL